MTRQEILTDMTAMALDILRRDGDCQALDLVAAGFEPVDCADLATSAISKARQQRADEWAASRADRSTV